MGVLSPGFLVSAAVRSSCRSSVGVLRVLGVPEDVRIQACIGTSLAIIVPTTIRSYIAHKKKGAVIPDVVRIWALPAVVGVVLGSIIAHYAPATLFKVVFVVFATLIALRMLFGTEHCGILAVNCRDGLCLPSMVFSRG